ncbi:MAG TPA: hypothetical protein VF666_11345 [Pyrinomonadaceae bacterium]|jgi:hypothetical protein
MAENTPHHTRAALVVAHPGHELRVYGWLEATRPRVFVLTDGSGRSTRSRIASTNRVLTGVGAAHGDIYARLTDADLYTAILDHEFNLFTHLTDELADALVREKISCVVGDAVEGYNPAHDACRLIVNAAVVLAGRALSERITNLDFTLVGRPDECPEPSRASALWLHLDDETFARKLTAARNYPELVAEVDAALSGAGSVGLRVHPDLAARSGINKAASADGGASGETFRVECLRPARAFEPSFDVPPFYEQYGERQVAAGHYARVLRYRAHMLPLAEALRSHVEKRNR